ncbi:MAG TPA: maltose alpha-D-glucosyltransferase [Methylomirabilota bacterium]|nr:maltose alpha-D-glucosyltransferase [Methylomirabilota bacterium]
MTQAGLWYKDAVFYEVHVKAFYDSNGDGIGDLAGLTEKLDYLKELGVDCLWLLPMYPSPLKDDGYDISDFYAVHPDYGSVEDFQKLLDAAHRRGIRAITDLVVNHTSDQHPWFREARSSPDSPFRHYYVWSDTDQRYKGVRIIFIDTEKSNWTWDPAAKAYYWHRFFSHQPDLNYDSPDVRKAMLDVMRFWLDRGLDGFRCDAVPYLFEREGTSCENLPETHAHLRELRRIIDKEYTGRVLLAEANQWPEDVRHYFGDGDEFHMAFHFPLMPRIYMAVHSEDRLPILDIFTHTPPIPDACQWGLFLRNHDELTLEMVTDTERDYMYYAYARDPETKLNLGIRRRLAPLMNNDRRKVELLNSLLFTLPGTPIIYYGDEIGMGDNVYLGDRNGVRTPMQWSGDRNAGFSTADPARLYLPVIADPAYSYQAVNVEAQLKAPTSLLSAMRRLIAARKSSRAFGRGSIEFLKPRNQKVLAYLRSYRQEALLIVNNLSGTSQPVELDLKQLTGCVPVELLGQTRFPQVNESPYFLSLGPYGFYWFRMERAGGHEEPYGIEHSVI